MHNKKKAVIWVMVLSIINGLIIYHTINWHLKGIYLEMLNWVAMDKGYITTSYNLGLMLVLGVLLGLWMENIIALLGYEVKAIPRFDNGAKTGERQ